MNKILFDASSTSTTSPSFYVAPGTCVLINAWNMGVGEVAEVWRLLTTPGSIPGGDEGKCSPGLSISSGQILRAEPYVPCNTPVQVGETVTQNITSIVLSQPGFYNLHLTPAALGTAVVEAVFLEGEDACKSAAAVCCCTPIQNWAGSSNSPCLTITPGGVNGNEPVFDLDPCCVLQQIVTPGIPALTDTIIVLQGGACVRATLQDVVDLVFVCGTLATFPLGAVAPLDSVVVVDMGANCKRLDLAGAVTALETPWTGISLNPFLTIAPGGVNGHAPTFDYDWCGDLQALPSCACEPNPGDLVPIVQGGACVLATWPEVDACAQMGAFPVGALVAGDTVFVREVGGVCKQVDASAFTANVVFPLLAPSGTCASPTYSFAASPDSGLWYNAVNGAVTLSDDNCTDLIEVGASVRAATATGFITIDAGYTAPGSNTGLIVRTNNVERLRIGSQGAWNLNTLGGGAPGDVITSSGPGAPPQWAAPAPAVVAFPLLASDGSCAAPAYSFASSPDSGMFYDPVGVGSVIIGDDNCVDAISIGASITVRTNSVDRIVYSNAGEWVVGGTPGVAGQAVISQGPGLPVVWGSPTASVRLNEIQDANGSATRAHGTNQVTWGWSGLGTFAAGLTITETAGANGAIALLCTSTTGAGNSGFPFRATWPDGGVFSVGGPAATGCVWTASGGAIGQEIAINAGSNTAGNGGGLLLRGGNSVANTGGGVSMLAGDGGQGGNASATGGASAQLGTTGGRFAARGGNNTNAGGGFGGDIDLIGGDTTLNPGTRQGNIFLNYNAASPIAAAAVKGFAYLPKIQGTPAGTPTFSALGGQGIPFIAQIVGATVVLWAHDGVAWRSVVLI